MRRCLSLTLLLALLPAPAGGEEAAPAAPPPFDLRLAHLHDGLRGPAMPRPGVTPACR